MVFTRTEYPVFSWSSSRKGTFDECRRKYYYNYYLAHNGWEDGADEEARLAYKLKKLTGIHLLLGSAVHEVADYAAKIVKSENRLPSEDTMIEKVRFLLNSAWKESQQPDLWEQNPNRYLILHSFYYGDGLSRDVVDKIKNKLYAAVPNILKSKTFKEILSCGGDSIKLHESMDTFSLFDVDIYAVPDLVYKNSSGKWVVADWKTGKEHDSHPSQIHVYCLYLADKYGVAAEEMTGRVEYLLTGVTREVEVTGDSLDTAVQEIKESIEKMKKELKDSEQNIPLAKEKYPLARHRHFCRYCNFYQLCREELQEENII